jgi:septal ring factor EnvC (AmiA/AmiB activator)
MDTSNFFVYFMGCVLIIIALRSVYLWMRTASLRRTLDSAMKELAEKKQSLKRHEAEHKHLAHQFATVSMEANGLTSTVERTRSGVDEVNGQRLEFIHEIVDADDPRNRFNFSITWNQRGRADSGHSIIFHEAIWPVKNILIVHAKSNQRATELAERHFASEDGYLTRKVVGQSAPAS